LNVDLQYLVHFLRRDLGKRSNLRNAGVVDHDVEPVECLLGVFDRLIHIVALREVRCEGGRLAAQLEDLPRDRAGRRVVDIHDSDVGPILGDAWSQIMRQEQASGCDLIVIGKQGRNAMEDMLLGSTTNRVLGESSADVLVCTQRDH
jgi:nucleotide-binding universal stress UspA family protein